MLIRALSFDRSAISIRLKKFGLDLKSSPPLPARAKKLFFLCGANRSFGLPSARRDAIKRFLEGLSTDYKVIFAEGVFTELTKFGHNKNVLDLEHEISDIADKIIIVLESPSAFCELGAFAHKNFRQKLVVINDLNFKSESSFINTGPVAAALEVKAPVLWYPMAADGVFNVDGVGAVFNGLKNAIKLSHEPPISLVDVSDLKANKRSLYFVHDLVLFLGPISHKELIGVLVGTFGKKNYDALQRLLGVLRAADLVKSFFVSDTWVYRSVASKPFMYYGTDVDALMATFRNFHLRATPARFKVA